MFLILGLAALRRRSLVMRVMAKDQPPAGRQLRRPPVSRNAGARCETDEIRGDEIKENMDVTI